MQRRDFLGLMLAGVVAGCGRNPEPAPSPVPTTAPSGGADAAVSFMVFGHPAEKAAFEELVKSFLAGHPGAPLTLTHIPSADDYRRRLALDFAGGRAPDVMLMNYRRYLAFAAKDMLEPLGPRLDASKTLKPADFFPEALEPFTLGDVLMGIPQNVSSLVVYYNRKRFEEAKVPTPKADWTWDDFLDTAKRLTDKGRYGLGVQPLLIRLAPFVWQNGGELAVPHPDSEKKLVFSWASTPMKPAFDLPATRQAMQWFVELQTKHHVVPSRVEEESQDSEARFMSGSTAMFLDSRRAVPSFREIQGFEWDVAPLPRGKKQASILHADGYFVSATSRNKDLAWSFVEFANSPEGQTIMARTGRTVPSLRSVAQSPAFLDAKVPPASSRVWLDAVPVMRPLPVMDTWDEVEGLANREIERAFYGDVSVGEAADHIQTLSKEYFDRAITR